MAKDQFSRYVPQVLINAGNRQPAFKPIIIPPCGIMAALYPGPRLHCNHKATLSLSAMAY
ncbi:MAG: hypothetical protein ABH934_02720 [Chloroflexota bacterium]